MPRRDRLQQPSSSNGDAGAHAAAGGAARPRYATLGKDPGVRTDFLPDRDRAREEEELREKLKREYALRTAAVKAEPLDITYSYYNGTGHRRTVTVRKGDSVGQFLKAVIEQLGPSFRELRNASAGNLMYVKEVSAGTAVGGPERARARRGAEGVGWGARCSSRSSPGGDVCACAPPPPPHTLTPPARRTSSSPRT